MVPSQITTAEDSSLQGKRSSISNDPKKKHGNPSLYHVDGYTGFMNMWEKIYDLTTAKSFNKVQERRIRSNTMVYLSETQDLYLTTRESIKNYYKNEQSNKNKYKSNFGLTNTSNNFHYHGGIGGGSR
jgi:hypothetical protein